MSAKTRKITARDYLKIIEWSDEDQCFIGSAPPLIGRCCHGTTEVAVMRELGRIVEEWIALHGQDRRPLPAPSMGQKFSGKFVLRVPAQVHQALALRAQAAGKSLNAWCAEQLAETV